MAAENTQHRKPQGGRQRRAESCLPEHPLVGITPVIELPGLPPGAAAVPQKRPPGSRERLHRRGHTFLRMGHFLENGARKTWRPCDTKAMPLAVHMSMLPECDLKEDAIPQYLLISP